MEAEPELPKAKVVIHRSKWRWWLVRGYTHLHCWILRRPPTRARELVKWTVSGYEVSDL